MFKKFTELLLCLYYKVFRMLAFYPAKLYKLQRSFLSTSFLFLPEDEEAIPRLTREQL